MSGYVAGFVLLGMSCANAATWRVDPSGDDAAAGTPAAPFRTWQRAADLANPGDLIELNSGNYLVSGNRRDGVKIVRSGTPAAPIILRGIGDSRPVLDCAGLTYSGSIYCLQIEANDWHIERVAVRGAKQPAPTAYATGIQLSSSQRVVLREVAAFENEGTGIRVVGDARDNRLERCDSYRNYDPLNDGGNADGFDISFLDATALGNVVVESRAFENSDDGFDLWMAEAAVQLEANYAFRNGYIPGTNTVAGNGDGFKLGMNTTGPRHRIMRNLAFTNRSRGFDANGAGGSIDVLNNTAWQIGGPPFSFVQVVGHRLRNNVAFGASNSFAAAVDVANNSWTLPVVVNILDFQNLDISAAAAERGQLGELPASTLLALNSSSDLIDQGVVFAGITYNGIAPDLGAREFAAAEFANGFE
jgi:Right handed beta helix region